VRAVRYLVAALGLAAAVGAASASGARGVQTLYTSTAGPIAAFAQDDSLVAWVGSTGRHRCNAVRLLSVSGARVDVTLPQPGTDNVTCRWNVGDGAVRLAIAASTTADAALWTLHQKAQISTDYVVGATARKPLERRFQQVAHTNAGAGLWLGGISGSGTTLVYGTAAVSYVDQLSCLSGGSCAKKVSGGGILRIVGRNETPLPGAGATVDVAAAAGRVAAIPATAVGKSGLPTASPGDPISVRDASSGVVTAQVAPVGVAVSLALSQHVLAVLLRNGAKSQIGWWDPSNGRLLGLVEVPAQTSSDLAASDQLVVFRVGRSIRGIDVSTGSIRQLAEGAATPVGLSLVGTRLAWAENVRGVGRIRALELG